MNYTINEWDERIEKLNDGNLKRIKEGLHTLNTWDYFKNAYGELGTLQIERIVDCEIKKRSKSL